jgi:excisionase family DNA binding protein
MTATKDAQERKTLTVEEAARVLGIGRQVAYELARIGKLPGVLRLGHRYVISRIALDRYLESAPAGREEE